MKSKEILLGSLKDGSKFHIVLAAAKRSKQLNRMSKDRGLPPNQVALIKTDLIKPPTIALMEINKGKIEYGGKEIEMKEEPAPASASPEESMIPAQE